MKLETFTEITAAENARRRRAIDYEAAKRAVDNLERRIERLKSQQSEALSTLESVVSLANTLPKDVQGSIGGLVPIAGEVRTLVVALASSGLASVRRADEQRQAQLRDAEQQLKQARKALAAFTETEQ
jgi:hypothetical protein